MAGSLPFGQRAVNEGVWRVAASVRQPGIRIEPAASGAADRAFPVVVDHPPARPHKNGPNLASNLKQDYKVESS
jgi:hypothetical protein